MQIDSDAEEETQTRADGEKSDRAKDNNQVSIFLYHAQCRFDANICIIMIDIGARYGGRF